MDHVGETRDAANLVRDGGREGEVEAATDHQKGRSCTDSNNVVLIKLGERLGIPLGICRRDKVGHDKRQDEHNTGDAAANTAELLDGLVAHEPGSGHAVAMAREPAIEAHFGDVVVDMMMGADCGGVYWCALVGVDGDDVDGVDFDFS